jgi:uncharacterized protein involved in exopolysaccharide biosynthesis
MPMDSENINVQEQVQRYLRLLRERWYRIAVVTVIALLIGFGLAQLWPLSYEANTFFVLHESQLVDDSTLEKSLKAMRVGAKQSTLVSEIRSRSRIVAVLDKLGWKEYITAQMNPGTDLMNFMAKVSKNLNVAVSTDTTGETQVRFTFVWNDPRKAADFCNTMRDTWMDIKIDGYMQTYRERLDAAEVLLQERDKDYMAAQAELEKFDRETNFASLGNLEINNKVKIELRGSISLSRSKVTSLGKQIEKLKGELAVIPQKIDNANKKQNPEYVKALNAYTKADKSYKTKQESYTENNPKLIQAKAQLDSLEEALLALKDKEYTVEGIQEVLNPLFATKSQQLDTILPEHEIARENLMADEARLEEIEATIQKLPHMMSERAALQATVALTLEEYNAAHTDILPLQGRVQTFRSFAEKDGIWEGQFTFRNQTFEVLQISHPPNEPTNPMMIIILSVAFFVGLGLGVVFALIGEVLKSSFSSQEEVSGYLGKPVLGMVDRIITEADLRAMRWRKGIMTSTSLLVIFSLVAIIYICNQYPQLIPDGVVEKVNQIRESMG